MSTHTFTHDTKKCNLHSRLRACAHGHRSPSDPTSTIREVYNENSSPESSPPSGYATFECLACKFPSVQTQNQHGQSPSPSGHAFDPSPYSPTSNYSSYTDCYYADDEITSSDSDIEADIQAWRSMVNDNGYRDTDGESFTFEHEEEPLFRDEGIIDQVDEEHGCAYAYNDRSDGYDGLGQMWMLNAVQALVMGAFILILVSVVCILIAVLTGGSS
ncbi:hypothetical protein ONS95_008630 [Cadophora gregata]|uniref:uncharacterized protein n=1 Tax=Cadophora gregata TaxID=51156 RepID=UPI0026DD1E80|nr:uncharacterized protein ONS95_008630 [Cadophora gregata]KAK0123613.1 hypothetical protein ONS95_008630 [Cadophora gregata]KAK0129954.1 hypothetical protein ONS96_000495 [Cadophora gregata f. sp. sojae]